MQFIALEPSVAIVILNNCYKSLACVPGTRSLYNREAIHASTYLIGTEDYAM
jgi:hypothetical protein